MLFRSNVVATDGLGNSGSAAIQWNVQSGPAAPMGIAPAQGATGVFLNTVLSWSATGNSYFLNLAIDSNMNNVVFTNFNSEN